MQEIINIEKSEMTAEYKEALQTHQRIMANGEICAQSLFEICKDLKKMRDQKLYEEFGYASFEEYCEKMAGIKSRMAYNYISTLERLGATVLQSNARLGITKLELIAGMNPVERVEKLESGELDGMSVAEIRELVRKSKEQGEQISLLENQIAEMGAAESEDDAEADGLREEIAQLQAELREKENAHKIELETARKEATEAAQKEAERIIAEAGSSEAQDEKTKKEIEKAVAAAKKEAQKEAAAKAKEKAEKDKEKIAALEAALSAAGTEKEKLEKQLSLSDTNSAKAMVYIKALQDNFNALYALIDEMPDEQKNRFNGAVMKVIGAMQKKVEE